MKALSKLIRENSKALVCVDGITAVGAHELRFDEWGLDVCVTGSQKGLMIPPGLAFVALSKRAIEAMETLEASEILLRSPQRLSSLYEKNDTPWTPAVSLVIGVDAALEMLRAEGIENIWRRHERLATAIRAGVIALGLRLFSDFPSYAVTPVWLPEGWIGKCSTKPSSRSTALPLPGGRTNLPGKIFRISHLGYYDELDMVTMIGALELTLRECGYKFEASAPGFKRFSNRLHNRFIQRDYR